MTATEIRATVFASNAPTQERFRKNFGADIRAVTAALVRAQNEFRRVEQITAVEHRPATVLLYLYGAFNNLLTSVHLLVSGFPVPAGNMMRHYTECLAMGMMCAVDKCGVYERQVSKTGFPVHKAVSTAIQGKIATALEAALGVDPERWRRYAGLMKFFDEHSHASTLSIGYLLMFGSQGGLVLGGEFDPKKRAQYRAEFSARKQAAEVLRDVIARVSPLLPQKPTVP